MGANGSTAASCSSLDISHRSLQHHHLQQQQQQSRKSRQHKIDHQHRLAVAISAHQHRKFAPSKPATIRNQQLKQSKSYFDLSSPSETSIQVTSAENDYLNQTRPLVLVPALHLSGAKKSNAGVASRILHQRQQQIRSANLGKFSDSLPSLNNPSLHQKSHHHHNNNDNSVNSNSNHHHQHHHQATFNNSQHYHQNPTSAKYTPTSNRSYISNNSSNSNNNFALVSRFNSSGSELVETRHHNLNHKQQQQNQPAGARKSACHDSWLSPNFHQISHENRIITSTNYNQQQPLKRATSLSSLHNLHSNHLERFHDSQLSGYFANPKNSQVKGKKCLVSRQNLAKSSNCLNGIDSDDDEDGENVRHAERQNINIYKNDSAPNHQMQQLSNNLMPLAKKILKFKQVANVKSSSSSNKYKLKQTKQQQQLQQGCPVLPPLPRSQSLHELIQLRATENGQRMRSTGTLRGPLNGAETNNKVNLVAEMLESRRQQKLNEESSQLNESTTGQQLNSATMLSQTSSTDDGIHDISLNVDQSTSCSKNLDSNLNSVNHKQKTNSVDQQQLQQDNDQHQQGRQRLFKKKTISQQSSNVSQQNLKRSSQASSTTAKIKSNDDHNSNNDNKHLGLISKYSPSQKTASTCNNNNNNNNKLKHIIDNSNQKSTLKRSRSHSTLHTISLDGAVCQNDGDESDDLNELAKFLYQFKQRSQASKQIRAHHQKDLSQAIEANDKQPVSNLTNVTQALVSPQQSPNSTTSSSGFASSTCTSNSISSSASNECGRSRKTFAIQSCSSSCSNSSSPAESNMTNNTALITMDDHKQIKIGSQNDPASNKIMKSTGFNPSRKKYPAPQRPNFDNDISKAIYKSIEHQNSENNSGLKGKCLISSKLKLSSSLLSIVDEYNSTLQANSKVDDLSRAKSDSCHSNLTAVLLAGNKINAEQNTLGVVGNKQTENTNKFRAEQEMRVVSIENSHNNQSDLFDDTQRVNNDNDTKHCMQHCQLERLKRYTQLRQMSQSELALNHLNLVPEANIIKTTSGNRKDEIDRRNSKHPYKSKIINLIRRISDKSQVQSQTQSAQLQSMGISIATADQQYQNFVRLNSDLGGPQQAPFNHATFDNSSNNEENVNQLNSSNKQKFKPINQNETIALHSNQCNQLKYSSQNNNNKNNNTSSLIGDDKAASGTCENCQSSTSGDNKTLDNFLPTGQQNSSSTAATNEWVCSRKNMHDVNFDCDFELIKNCGTEANDLDRNDVTGQQKISLNACRDVAKTKMTNGKQHCKDTTKKQQQQQQHQQQHHQAQKVSKDLVNTNWRLVPASFNKSATCLNGDIIDIQSRLGQPKELSLQQTEQQSGNSKLKWPAKRSGWLMNGGQTKVKSQAPSRPTEFDLKAAGNDKRAIHNKHQMSASINCCEQATNNNSNKIGCFHKCYSSNNNIAKMTEPNSCKTNSNVSSDHLSDQADVLLCELDESLDLVSSKDRRQLPFCRKTALTCWERTESNGAGQVKSMSHLQLQKLARVSLGGASNSEGSETSDCDKSDQDDDENFNDKEKEEEEEDDDDDDDGNYASLNRAMINEIFQVDLLGEINLGSDGNGTKKAGSPSNSFTFSAPGGDRSDTASGRCLVKQQVAAAANLACHNERHDGKEANAFNLSSSSSFPSSQANEGPTLSSSTNRPDNNRADLIAKPNACNKHSYQSDATKTTEASCKCKRNSASLEAAGKVNSISELYCRNLDSNLLVSDESSDNNGTTTKCIGISCKSLFCNGASEKESEDSTRQPIGKKCTFAAASAAICTMKFCQQHQDNNNNKCYKCHPSSPGESQSSFAKLDTASGQNSSRCCIVLNKTRCQLEMSSSKTETRFHNDLHENRLNGHLTSSCCCDISTDNHKDSNGENGKQLSKLINKSCLNSDRCLRQVDQVDKLSGCSRLSSSDKCLVSCAGEPSSALERLECACQACLVASSSKLSNRTTSASSKLIFSSPSCSSSSSSSKQAGQNEAEQKFNFDCAGQVADSQVKCELNYPMRACCSKTKLVIQEWKSSRSERREICPCNNNCNSSCLTDKETAYISQEPDSSNLAPGKQNPLKKRDCRLHQQASRADECKVATCHHQSFSGQQIASKMIKSAANEDVRSANSISPSNSSASFILDRLTSRENLQQVSKPSHLPEDCVKLAPTATKTTSSDNVGVNRKLFSESARQAEKTNVTNNRQPAAKKIQDISKICSNSSSNRLFFGQERSPKKPTEAKVAQMPSIKHTGNNNNNSKFATSQISLANYYNGSNLNPKATILKGKDSLDTNLEFDENFILKRKTPNAGLKTRC